MEYPWFELDYYIINFKDIFSVPVEVKNGYPPQYSPEVFSKVMKQVENFEEYSEHKVISYYSRESQARMMVAEDSTNYGKNKLAEACKK